MFDEETNTTVPVEAESSDNEELEFFFDDKVRKVWHKQQEEWYMSVSDVVSVLTDSKDVKQYIKKMRSRDPELNSNWGTICTPIQMTAQDGKKRRVNAANIQGILRIIQSIPSKKAEPFKLWLAQVGKERLDEIADPELAFERMIRTYRQKGYSEKWIERRLEAIDHRKALTATWDEAGIKSGQQYAALTDTLTHEWSGKHVKEYKAFKGLHKENRPSVTSTRAASTSEDVRYFQQKYCIIFEAAVQAEPMFMLAVIFILIFAGCAGAIKKKPSR